MNKKNIKYLVATVFSLAIAGVSILPGVANAYSAPSVTPWDDNLDFVAFLNKIIGVLFTWVAPLCVLMIIIGGVVYMTAGDDEGKTKTGKGIVKFALIGLAIVLAAGMLMNFVANIGK